MIQGREDANKLFKYFQSYFFLQRDIIEIKSNDFVRVLATIGGMAFTMFLVGYGITYIVEYKSFPIQPYIILLIFAIFFVIFSIFLEERGGVYPWFLLGGAITSVCYTFIFTSAIVGIRYISKKGFGLSTDTVFYAIIICIILSMILFNFARHNIFMSNTQIPIKNDPSLIKSDEKTNLITTEPEKPIGESRTSREPIPDKVKLFVWNRDGGRCVNCGSNEKLEYDHIIPLSKGGSNTARNIQLLCENCNRSKGANIGNEPVNEPVIAKPSAIVSLQELKDELAKINERRDELEETFINGEITEAKYKELDKKYRIEADNLKNQIAKKKYM